MHERRAAFRIADANWNRVMEGLRTLEDIARFLDLAQPQARYKGIRHAMQEAFQQWDRSELLAARDADEDVGRTEKVPSELLRAGGLEEIAASAAGRCEQGLRVLEETAKFLYPSSAARIEALRYQMYDLNAEVQLALKRDLEFLNRAQLYVLVDCRLPLDLFLKRIVSISESGVDLIQVRDKTAEPNVLIEYTNAAVDALDRNRTRVIVNDRIDVANCSKAWGAHVGQEDIPAQAARRLLRGDQVLGLSTHDLDQIQKAIEERVDYIGCGPTFPSQTKAFSQFAGLDFLSQVAGLFDKHGLCRLPAFAIGGITPENLQQVLVTGFNRIAVSSCVWNATDPAAVTGILKEKLTAKRDGRRT